MPCLRLTATLCKVALDKRAVRRGKFFLRRPGARSRHRFHGRGWKRFSSKGFVVARRCDTVGGLCGRRHADLSVPRMVHCPVARRHLDGGSVRRIGALGVVVSLVALVSASAADGAGPGPAKDVFPAIVGSILGGPTSGVHGTDGRHYVVYELVLTKCQGRAGNPAGAGGAGPRARTRSAPPSARDSCPSIARSSTLSRPLGADATVSLGVASVTS